jgi:hypothetical protein
MDLWRELTYLLLELEVLEKGLSFLRRWVTIFKDIGVMWLLNCPEEWINMSINKLFVNYFFKRKYSLLPSYFFFG